MASSVYYKFKSQKTESRVTFDGTGISVFDLKKEILIANKLEANAKDFDLSLSDSSGKEYKNDSEIIPRSTSVTAKRLPPVKPGKGKAAMYLAGISSSNAASSADAGAPKASTTGNTWTRAGISSMSKRFDGKDDKPKSASAPASSEPAKPAGDDEDARIQAMFQATTEQWQTTQERMAQATPIYKEPRGGPRKNFAHHQPHYEPKPLPPGYICHRCSKKGHWIQDCPTNDDRDYDNRPRIKRTTGIPKSFLKTVELPTDGALPSHGVMVTPEGGFVVAQPDSASWEKQRARPKGITPADVREKPPTDSTLACPICSKLFRDAVKTPCCSRTYCEECIQTHLLERDFVCPGCQSKISSLDKLTPHKETRSRVSDYIGTAIAKGNKEEGDAPQESASVGDNTTTPNSTDANIQDQEVSFDQQPGHEVDQLQAISQNLGQLEAHRNQLLVMLNQNLPPPMHMQVQMQLEGLNMQIQQATMMATLSTMNNNPMALGGMNNMGNMSGMGPMGLSNANMNNFQNPMGYNNRGYRKGEYLPGWTNPFPNQQPAGEDSAYQRLPVNNRRRGPKRDRPSDFVEVGMDGSQAKVARYWE